MKIRPLILLTTVYLSTPVNAFTQLGGKGVMPIGHEWLTRTAALEILTEESLVPLDPYDPRLLWQRGLAKNTDLSTANNEVRRILSSPNSNSDFYPKFDDIYAAIVGERWVDIAGFNVTNASVDPFGPNCFSAVSQEPAHLQQDHFMRRYDDIGGQGGVNAAYRAQQRFISHFITAAMAQEKSIKVWDGGGYSAKVNVDHNYFLFGRAVHLFQDSFSPEHTVRLPSDNYESIRQVKAYLCSEGAEQHSHDTKEIINFKSGDVIWKEDTRLDIGWDSHKASNIKPVALVALEASKDLWAAFIRTMATPRDYRAVTAQYEAEKLVSNWLSFNEQSMLNWYNDHNKRDHTYVLAPNEIGPGKTLEACMASLNVNTTDQLERVLELQTQRAQCLYNIEAEPGYEDLNDPYIDIPYNWRWKSKTWLTPPDNWKITQLPADSGESIYLHTLADNRGIYADSTKHNQVLALSNDISTPFIQVQNEQGHYYFRSKEDPTLFLSYSNHRSGYAKLWSSPDKASYELRTNGNSWSIKNVYWQ